MALSSLSRLREIARATRAPDASGAPVGPRPELTYEPVGADGLPIDPRLDGEPGTAIDVAGARLDRTPHGDCLVVEAFYEGDRSHGRVAIHECGAVDVDETLELLAGRPLGRRRDGGHMAPVEGRRRIVYFDLETTGLSGGAGMVAFLAGVGEWTSAGFRTTQFLLPSFASERALLHALNDYLGDEAILVTYNGRTFDVPVMEMRGEMHRVPQVVCELPHLDLLHAARRLWRSTDEGDRSCRLTHLEEAVLGVGRVGDVAGFEIPARYFAFVRGESLQVLEPVLLHNRLDLLSLAALTAHAQRLVRDGREATPTGATAYGLATLYERAGWMETAVGGYRSVVEDPWQSRDRRRLAARALARLLRRLRRYDEAAAVWQTVLDLGGTPQVLREAREALAVHHEHRNGRLEDARRHAVAGVEEAIGRHERDRFARRLARLDRKLARATRESPLWRD